MNVVILVPYRPDSGPRDALWRFCRARWERLHPDWPIIEGVSPDGPFNRSAALNDAAHKAGAWDVALCIDADVCCDPRAVADAVGLAAASRRVVVAHNERIMLNKQGTDKVLAGFDGPWRVRQMVETVYSGPVSCVSCAVAIPRAVWEDVGGYDPRFVGWGFEDSAFAIAVGTLRSPFVNLAAETYHLHHPRSPETVKTSPTYRANAARLAAYVDADGDPDAVRALLAEPTLPQTRIPRLIHRTVPAETTDEVEGFWARFGELHPGWDLRTWREPLDAADFPLTADLWPRCQNGAQKAGLVRLELLWTHGGVYADSDVEPFRSFEPLLNVEAFAGWEDETTVPDFLLGSRPGHPVFEEMLTKARRRVEAGGDAWQSGPGVTTECLPGRADVLLLPPGAFAPYHYLQKHERPNVTAESMPWAWCAHHWHHSWGSEQSKRSIAQRQRR